MIAVLFRIVWVGGLVSWFGFDVCCLLVGFVFGLFVLVFGLRLGLVFGLLGCMFGFWVLGYVCVWLVLCGFELMFVCVFLG